MIDQLWELVIEELGCVVGALWPWQAFRADAVSLTLYLLHPTVCLCICVCMCSRACIHIHCPSEGPKLLNSLKTTACWLELSVAYRCLVKVHFTWNPIVLEKLSLGVWYLFSFQKCSLSWMQGAMHQRSPENLLKCWMRGSLLSIQILGVRFLQQGLA